MQKEISKYLNVLMVENRKEKADVLKSVLIENYPNHNLTLAYNFEQACNLVQSKKYDLIILDLSFPMDSKAYINNKYAGKEFLYFLWRKNITNIPIVLFSASNRGIDMFEKITVGKNTEKYKITVKLSNSKIPVIFNNLYSMQFSYYDLLESKRLLKKYICFALS